MVKIAVVVFADTETHEGMGRVSNAFELAKEAKDNNDEVQIVFDGAGVKWIPELVKPENKLHPLFGAVSDNVAGVCDFCAGAFGVKEKVKKAGIPLLAEYDRHPSLHRLVTEGFQVITF